MPISTFCVLIVCTGNLCRSPMAEFIFKSALEERWPKSALPWVVESAGTQVKPNLPMHPFALEILRERDIPAMEFRTRVLSADLISRADLILTAERQHRVAVVKCVPSAVRLTFTLRQFARIANQMREFDGADPVESGRYLLAESVSSRAQLQPVAPKDDDIIDPMGKRIDAFRRCADSIQVAVAAILGRTTERAPTPRGRAKS